MILVFGHGCHSVFVGAKLHVCFSGRLPVRSHIDVDPQRIQRGEELHEEERNVYTQIHEQGDTDTEHVNLFMTINIQC